MGMGIEVLCFPIRELLESGNCGYMAASFEMVMCECPLRSSSVSRALIEVRKRLQNAHPTEYFLPGTNDA